MDSGRRLTKKASFTAVFTLVRAQFSFRVWGVRVVRTGYVRRKKIMSRLDAIIVELLCIAATWICTKSFWFLRPTDDCYPLGALGASEPWSSTKGTEISILCIYI